MENYLRISNVQKYGLLNFTPLQPKPQERVYDRNTIDHCHSWAHESSK